MIVSCAVFIGCSELCGLTVILLLLLERCPIKESNVISKIKDKIAPKGAKLP